MQSIIELSYDYAHFSLLFYSAIQHGTIDAIHFNIIGHKVISDSRYSHFYSKLKINLKLSIHFYFCFLDT